MKNMKQNFNEKLKQKVIKIAINAGDDALGGRCWGMLYEPTIPEKLLLNEKEKENK